MVDSALEDLLQYAPQREETPAQEQPTQEVENVSEETTEDVVEEQETEEQEATDEAEQVEAEATENQSTETTPEKQKEWYEDNSEAEDEYQTLLKNEFGIEKIDAKAIYEKIKEAATKEPAKDPLDDDPLVKAVKNIRMAGGDVQEFVKLIGTTDPATLTQEQVFQMELSKYNLSEEQVTEEMERFNDKSFFEKQQLVKPIVERMSAERENKLKEFNAAAEQQAQWRLQVRDKALQEIETNARGFVGKDFYGTTITEPMAQRIEHAAKQFNVMRADGTFDTEKIVNMVALNLFKADIVKSNVAKATANGKKAILKEIHQPSKTTSVRTAAVHGKQSEMERANELLEARHGG